MRAAVLALVVGVVAALAARGEAFDVTPARVGRYSGPVVLTAGADGGMVLVARTRRGLVVRRSRDGRRFDRPRTIAPASANVDLLRATIGADGGVLVAWTASDYSIDNSEERDFESCCTRLWVGGLTPGGRVLRAKRLSHGRRRSVGTPAVGIRGGRRYVATTRPGGVQYRGLARVWHGTGRRWSRGRAFAGRGSPYRLGFRRIDGRTRLVGADSRPAGRRPNGADRPGMAARRSPGRRGAGAGRRRAVRRVRAWPIARGRARTLLRLGARRPTAIELAGDRVNGLFERDDREYAFTAARGRLAETRLRQAPLESRDVAGDGRGRVVLAGARSPRRPVVVRIVQPTGRVTGRIHLGRLAPRVRPYGVELLATAAASGVVTVWATVSTDIDERIVRLRRLPDGRIRRTVDTDRPKPVLQAAATTASGTSVAVVEIEGRLWLAR